MEKASSEKVIEKPLTLSEQLKVMCIARREERAKAEQAKQEADEAKLGKAPYTPGSQQLKDVIDQITTHLLKHCEYGRMRLCFSRYSVYPDSGSNFVLEHWPSISQLSVSASVANNFVEECIIQIKDGLADIVHDWDAETIVLKWPTA